MFYKVRKQFGYIQILKLKNAFSARLARGKWLVVWEKSSIFVAKR
jgi:hypothetical protein